MMLAFPRKYLELINAGVLPNSAAEADKQLSRPFQSRVAISRIFPEEARIGFYAMPLRAIAAEAGDFVWKQNPSAFRAIGPEDVFPFAHFGMGSDTCLAFHFADLSSEPRIIRLVWDGGKDTAFWSLVASNFEEFWALIDGEEEHY